MMAKVHFYFSMRKCEGVNSFVCKLYKMNKTYHHHMAMIGLYDYLKNVFYKLSPKSSRNFSIKRFGQLLVGSRPPMKKRSTGGS